MCWRRCNCGRLEWTHRAVADHVRQLEPRDVHHAGGSVAAGVGEGVVLLRLGILDSGKPPAHWLVPAHRTKIRLDHYCMKWPIRPNSIQ